MGRAEGAVRLSEPPTLIGHAAAAAAFEAARVSGQLHHAWLLAGPEGIGKALFARIAAARLLAEAAAPGALPEALAWPEGSRTATLMANGAHPDFRVIARLPKDPDEPDGELARSITIAQVRSLGPMLATAPALAPRRVIVIDAIDELEGGAPNALLKMLEEPPQGTIFLLVSHAPGRLLPTIRSRCRVLSFEPLTDAQTRAVVTRALPDLSTDEVARLAAASDGSPGLAIGFAGLDIGTLDEALNRIATTGDHANRDRLALGKALALKAAQPRYEAFLGRAVSLLAAKARDRRGPALAAALAGYDDARSLADVALRQSFDRHATVITMAGIVARLAG